MTTTLSSTPASPGIVSTAKRNHPASTKSIVGDVLRSEWTRLYTVRSTYWTLLVVTAAMVGLSAMVSSIYVAQFDQLTAKSQSTFNPITYSLVGGGTAQLAAGVLGVLFITNEYSSGMIRSTFAATPQRITVLSAKATVFGTVIFVVTTIAAFAAFFIGQAILSAKDVGASITSAGALRSVIGTGLYLGVIGVISLGLGTLIRNTAGAIGALFGILFIVPIVVSLLPDSINGFQKYLPSNAGQEIIFGSGLSTSDVLSPWAGFAVFSLYAVVILGAAGALLVRRDA